MADAERIIDRVRAFGADIILDGGGLRLVAGNKLPQEAVTYVAANQPAILRYLQEQIEDAVDERAAIIEFEAGAPRDWAEQFARILYRRRPAGVSDLDWSWFVTACGRIIDEAPERAAA